MPWFMDPMPDGDSVHQVAQAYQTAHAAYTPHIQQTQTALATTTPVWSGPGSAAHSQVVAATQQHANDHAGWLVAIANVLYVAGTILKIVFVLQMAWLALQALTLISSILTAGATAPEGEAGAAMIEAAITALRVAVQQIMRAAGQALMRLLIGAAAGGLTGLAVGVNTVETHHLSGWGAFSAIAMDTVGGAGAGAMIATNPVALIGTGVALGQIGTNAALGGPTSFEQGGAQWAQQTLGGLPLVGGSLASAFAPPTDVQSGFDTIIADTLAVGGVSEMFASAESDAAGLKPNDTSTADSMDQSARAPRVPGPRTSYVEDMTQELDANGVPVTTSTEAQDWLQGDPAVGRGPANASLRIKNDGSMDIAAYTDWSDAEMLEEVQHAERALARAENGLPKSLASLPGGTAMRWMEEVEVETRVLQEADAGLITITPEERANLENNINSYVTDLQGKRIVQADSGDYAGQFVHVNRRGQIDQVWNWGTLTFDDVYPPVDYHGTQP